MEIPIAILLHQHSTRGNRQSISHNKEREVGVGVMEDWMFEKGILELLEQGLMIWKPLPCHILLCQEEIHNIREVRDKLSIEVAEIHKRAYYAN